ncbi:MAG: hypothetical protein WD737_03085 [Gemmatimonadota bacterium]
MKFKNPTRIGAFDPPVIAAFVLCALAGTPQVAAQCDVEGEAAGQDLDLARQACNRASERFELLFGNAPPPGTVVVSDTVQFFSIASQGRNWKLVWPSSRNLREFFTEGSGGDRTMEEAVALQWSAVLPHELGHLMLDAEAEVRRSVASPTRRLPDWLHEGVAVWMEPPVHRRDEYAILRALGPYTPPVDDLLGFTIAHSPDGGTGGSTLIQTFYPCASEQACGGRPHWSRTFTVTTRHLPDGEVRVDTTFHEHAPPPPGPLAANFYAYAATFVRYLHHQGGATALSAVLDRYAGSSQDAISLAAIPGLPGDGARVEDGWRAWFTRWILEG